MLTLKSCSRLSLARLRIIVSDPDQYIMKKKKKKFVTAGGSLLPMGGSKLGTYGTTGVDNLERLPFDGE